MAWAVPVAMSGAGGHPGPGALAGRAMVTHSTHSTGAGYTVGEGGRAVRAGG